MAGRAKFWLNSLIKNYFLMQRKRLGIYDRLDSSVQVCRLRCRRGGFRATLERCTFKFGDSADGRRCLSIRRGNTGKHQCHRGFHVSNEINVLSLGPVSLEAT
jgi:hypothetical protein